MNKNLHKVIFNKSTGLMIAVCETAHNNGKSSKDKRFQVALFSLSGSLKTDLTAKNNVNIIAAQNTQSEKARNESVGAHIGVAFDVQGGSAIGVNIGGNYGKGKANGEEIAYRNSHVGSTTGKTTISAGETLNIKGGQVAGKGVAITAKDMNIESLQDTMAYNSKQQQGSVDVTIGYGFSGSASYSQSKINADYASVNEQSGIFAGDDGYQINVQNHTDLKGGIVTSTQKAEQDGKNAFSTGTLTFADLANHAEYKGEAIGLGVSGSVKGDNPNNPNSVVADKTGMSSTMGYGKDSDKQYATTHSGINTANITIRDNEKQQQITGKTAEETKRAVKTDLTIDNYAEHSGSLKNNFDKDKVQSEIDLQVKVTKEFRSNVQHFQAEQNKRKDELKAKLENNEISQKDYDEQISRIQKQSLLVNMVAGGLMSPSDSALGIATSTVSPAVSFQVGQHFKKEGKEGSFEHIATHAVIGALTSAANGGNALSGAVSAGGAEYIAKVTAETLFQKDAKDLTADEKQTVSSIAQLVGVVSGSVTGDSSANAYIGNLNAQTAVNNNLLSPDEWKELSCLDEKARKNGTLSKPEAERAKFLLNKHGYSEKLLAKEQNGETLSKNEQVYLDNAVWEQADGNPDIAKNIRKYKGSVQSDYRELNKIADREIGYNSSVQGQLSQTMQPVVAAGALYGTAYYLGGYTPTTFGGSVLQTFGQNVLTSNTIAKATGSNYDTATLVSDGVLVLPAMGLTKARTAMVSGSKLGLVQNPQTMKWVETTSQQGMPLYWRSGLYFEQKGLEIVGGDTTAKTLRQTTFKDNNKDIIQYNKKNNP